LDDDDDDDDDEEDEDDLKGIWASSRVCVRWARRKIANS